MADPLRLTVVSTSRSDFGLLAPVAHAAGRDARFRCQTLITGQHLLAGTPGPEELADLDVIRLPRPSDSLGHVHQVALAEVLRQLQAEVVLVLGDRYELLEVGLVTALAGTVLAHCSGGERTLGALDDLVRDAVTRLAHLHLPAHGTARERLLRLGEENWRIAVCGDPGLDAVLAESRPTPDELSALVGVRPGAGDICVAIHPVTRTPGELDAILAAVAVLVGGWHGTCFLSTANGDPGSDRIAARWAGLARRHPRCRPLASLGSRAFRGLVAACGVLVGNSSAGLVEAPSLGTPSVDIGSRQRGRLRGTSVVDCPEVTPEALRYAVDRALASRRAGAPFDNPYGDGRAVPRILDHLWAKARQPSVLVKS